MEHRDLTTYGWNDYELIDSGNNRKLERFGKLVLIRPETQALWKPSRNTQEWNRADAEFRFREGGKGGWHTRTHKKLPASWEMQWHDNIAKFTARPTSFKHTGIFPEQESNWEWIAERTRALVVTRANTTEPIAPRVLNLFGYTGIASIVAAHHGAYVTHCDASKQSNNWAHDNARSSGIVDKEKGAAPRENAQRQNDHHPHGRIRYLTDDALKFAERELRRGASYDGIILDPPAFGRGAKGEVFHIETHLPPLLNTCASLLAKRPGAFFLLNGYAAGYAPQSFLQVLEDAFPELRTPAPRANRAKHGEHHGEFGELRIGSRDTDRVISSGIYARFIRPSE